MDSYLEVVVFLLVGAAVPIIGIWVGSLLRPHRPYAEKLSVYECGSTPIGDARLKFNIRFYIFALVFVVFDLEAIYLYPWAVVFKDLGLFAFVEMIVFLAILAVGLIYAWQKKVLRWL